MVLKNDHADCIDSIKNMFEAEWSVGIRRPYSAEEVHRAGGCRDSFGRNLGTLASTMAHELRSLFASEDFVVALGALSGQQAIQYVQAGLKVIYGSGWQVAAAHNNNGEIFPDQSLYDATSMPKLVREINRAFLRKGQIGNADGTGELDDWFVPIIADAEAGFGGNLNAFNLMTNLIYEGAACVHFEDQDSRVKKCGHLGGKVVVPVQEFIDKLVAARLAADVMGVPTVLIARTDAERAGLLSNVRDVRDETFLTGEKTVDGYYVTKSGLDAAIMRALEYAPYADLLWCETHTPDLKEARRFADAVHEVFPDKWLAYNLSPSFKWKKFVPDSELKEFNRELGAMGYKFQFVTLAGFHANNLASFLMADSFAKNGIEGYVCDVQEQEITAEVEGYDGTEHQKLSSVTYFDVVASIISPDVSTTAVKGSTMDQFKKENNSERNL